MLLLDLLVKRTQNAGMLWQASPLRGAVGKSVVLTASASTLSEGLLLVASSDKMLYND